MSRCRTYPFVHPLRGCGDTRGDAHPYQAPVPVGTWWAGDLRPCRAFAPNGDEGRNNQHLGARHVSAATPLRCDGSTTILHSPFFILNWSHTFSAKERDSETGLSYFGARYYSSDLSIWLSVDPMSDKYPSLSPYTYCANNPVKLVDPNGEEWYVNQDGNIVEGTNKDDHTLYAVKGKKNEFGDRLIYRRGDQKGKEISMPVDDEIMRSFKTDENGYSQMDLTGKEESGLEMMRFFSRHTNVEWSFWGGNTWDKESETESAFATIGTSHSYSKDEFSTIPILNASRKLGERHTTPLRFFIHTHPHQEIWGTWASRNDRKIKECCEICSPSAQFGIMHRGILYDYENNRIKISF